MLTTIVGIFASRLTRFPLSGEYFRPGDLAPFWWSPFLWTSIIASIFCFGAAVVCNTLTRPRAHSPRTIALNERRLWLRSEQEAATAIELRDVAYVGMLLPVQAGEKARYRLELRLRDGEHVHLEFPSERVGLAVAKRLQGQTVFQRYRWPIKARVSAYPAMTALVFIFIFFAWAVALVTGSFIVENLLTEQNVIPAQLYTLLISGMLALAGSLKIQRRALTIGSEGVVIHGWRRRYIPFADIGSISPLQTPTHGLRIGLKAGGAVEVHVFSNGRHALDHLREALARYGAARPEHSAEVAILARGDRSMDDWSADLRRLARDGNYRENKLRPEHLEALVDDSRAHPEQRIAAAVGLVAADAGAGAERIRIAAGATADKDLKAALEAAAEGEIAERSLKRVVKRYARKP